MFDDDDDPFELLDPPKKKRKADSDDARIKPIDDRQKVRQPANPQFVAALQQFLLQTGGIQRSFVEKFSSLDEMIDNGTALKAPLDLSRQLAEAVVVNLTGDRVPNQQLVRGILAQCCDFVSARWKPGAKFDVDKVASSVADAFRLANPDRDVNPFDGIKTSMHAAFAMSSTAVTIEILKEVIEHDLGDGVEETAKRLTDAVLEMSVNAANQVLSPDADESDRQPFLETFSRRAAELMCCCYRKRARDLMAKAAKLAPQERDEFLKSKDAVGLVIKDFKTHASYWAGLSLVYARGLTDGKRSLRRR